MKKTTFFPLPALGLLLTALSLLSGCSATYNGEKLFYSVGCSQCHTFRGRGGSLAPDLSAITNIRSDSWIDSYLQDPKEMNPQARMPSFRQLSGSERKAIIAFLKK
jgi:cytochrome c2